MSVMLVVLSAVVMTALPPRGVALETKAGVELQSLSGTQLGALRGLDLAPDAFGRGLVMRNGRGRLFLLDWKRRRLIDFARPPLDPPGCRLTDGFGRLDLLICGRTLKTARYGTTPRVVARAPAGVGHWVRAEFSPSGDAILAQWSAECEVPVAYLVSGGVSRAYGAESVALGWLPGGEALIHFPNGPCGGSSHARGIYAVPRRGKRRLIRRTPRFAQYAMWGG